MKFHIFTSRILQSKFFHFIYFHIFNKLSFGFFVACIIPFFSLDAQYKSLDWNSIQVVATLKNNGNLAVSETQSIRFSGDWNGAYRKFETNLGQKIHFHSLEIQRANGEWEILPNDSIDMNDSYLYDPLESTVKWRSRNSNDPSFDNETIVYRLNYEYENILNYLNDNIYQLDHDFGFEDRSGEIRFFLVELHWEDLWQMSSLNQLQVLPSEIRQSQLTFSAPGVLKPGKKMIVKTNFEFIGNPSSLNYTSVLSVYGMRIFHFLILLLFAGLISILIYLHCKKNGLLKDAKKLKSWEEFREYLGDLLPEEIAILSEKGLVASWMTRMILEKKIQFLSNQGEDSKLKLLVDRSSFTESDGRIIENLFVDGVNSISISELKTFYKKNKASYSLSESIRYETNRNLVAKGILPVHQSFFGKLIKLLFDKVFMNTLFFFLFVIVIFFIYKFFIEHKLELNHISDGRFFIFLFCLVISRIIMSLFDDDHYGFYDLQYNRIRYFRNRYLLSMIPSFLIFAFYFWSLELTIEMYSILFGIAGLTILEYLWNTNPIKHMQQIEISLRALSMKNFLDAKLIANGSCDIPQEYASYIPAFDLEFDLEYRIEKLGKPDCLYLLPQYFDNWKEVLNQYQKSQTSQSKSSTFTYSLPTGENSDSYSSQSALSSGVVSGITLGGLFGGAGASASWSQMSEFSSSAQYSPPSSSSSSSSGSSSSGGGGGGGW